MSRAPTSRAPTIRVARAYPILLLALGLPLAAPPAGAAEPLTPRTLWAAWPAARVVPTAAPCLRPAELEERLRELAGRHPGGLRLEEVGRSVEGRPIHRMILGAGPASVLLWSQMHGDEPSATPALLDLADYLLSRAGEPEVARLLERLTLVMVPMLNPDGAERYTRRNAQGIDVNRDALHLATPEGRLLARLREEHRPILGFNLHDQNRRRTVGETRRLAAGAVLAVVGDAEKTVTPGRLRAMRAGAAVATALEPFVPGGLARFDDSYSPRSFGDQVTAWGTPVLLVESGGVPAESSLAELTRLNFVVLGFVLGELARDDLAGFDPAVYAALPENNADVWADVALRGGELLQPIGGDGRGLTRYRADLAFDRLVSDREREGCAAVGPPRSKIVELGDAHVFGAGREIDATGRRILPAFVVGAEGWRARRLLDGPGLEALARSGVAKVRWWVPERRLAGALRRAAELSGPRRPALEVTTDRSDLPRRRLDRRLERPAEPSLAAQVGALERATAAPPAPPAARLAALWSHPLRPEVPADFLVVAAAGEDPLSGELERIFLGGIELSPGDR